MTLLALFSDVSTTTLVEGIVIAIVGYSVVFAALVLLYFSFSAVSKLVNKNIKIKLRRSGKISAEASDEDISVPAEVAAAIGLALYMSTQLHDEESNIITIKKVSRTYSPWSSKIYGMRNLNR